MSKAGGVRSDTDNRGVGGKPHHRPKESNRGAIFVPTFANNESTNRNRNRSDLK